MADFGSGPTLDENLDFTITTTGDIETGSGDDELAKDLAFRIHRAFEDIELGMQFTESAKEDLRIDIGVALGEDARVESVSDITLVQNASDRNQLDIGVTVETADGPFDLVIPYTP